MLCDIVAIKMNALKIERRIRDLDFWYRSFILYNKKVELKASFVACSTGEISE